MTALEGVPAEAESYDLGSRLRATRQARGISVRELAKRVGCSPSNISGIERGITQPSISTLTAIVKQLDISMESVFEPRDLAARSDAHGAGPDRRSPDPEVRLTSSPPGRGIVRRGKRPRLRIESGVVSESLLAAHEDEVDFCIYSYEPGGASVANAQVIRHPGREYGMVLEGTLRVQIGFEEYTLEEGDSIAFRSTEPHRYWNDTDHVARVIWFSGSTL